MFNHLTVGSDDVETAKTFYDATFSALEIGPGFMDGRGRAMYVTDTGLFVVTKPINGEPATSANGITIGLRARSPEQIDAWHSAGLANGGVTCEDPPGYRQTEYGPLYAAYLRDPAGNKLCAIYNPAGEWKEQ